MNRVTMILGAGLIGLAVTTAPGSPGHSSSNKGSAQKVSTPFKVPAQMGNSFRNDVLRGEHARVLAQNSKKGNSNPNKGKFDPNKTKIDPNKIKIDTNKGKFDPNKGKIDIIRSNKGDQFRKFDPHMWGRGMVTKNGQFLANHHITGGAFKKLPDRHHQVIKGFAQSKNVSPAQKTALNKINNGQQLSAADRQGLSNMMSNPPADMTPEVREAVNAALTLDGRANRVERYTRILQLYNETDDVMKVWVQYHTYTDKNTWSWFPTSPGAETAKAVAYELKPGKSTKLADGADGWIIHASRVRVWGKMANGTMIDEYRNNDLVIVPETNKAGEPMYVAAEQETYTYTLSADPAAAGTRP